MIFVSHFQYYTVYIYKIILFYDLILMIDIYLLNEKCKFVYLFNNENSKNNKT